MKKFTMKNKIKLLGGLLVLLLAVVIFGYQQNVFQTRADPNQAPGVDCKNIRSTSISEWCENQEVIVTGGTIDLSFVAVWQSGNDKGKSCVDPSRSDCDTKRRFTKLTVKNGAILTHAALTADDIDYSKNRLSSADGGKDDTIANDKKGFGRLKKVDIEVTGEINIEDGKINADGKGYPGGRASVNPNLYEPGYGPGGGVGVNGKNPYNNEYETWAGGGGFGGKGAKNNCPLTNGSGVDGCNPQRPLNTGEIYPNPFDTGNFDPDQFDFGSGGGGIRLWAPDGSEAAAGGAGGGRIKLKAKTITVTGDSSITADGFEGKGAKSSNRSLFFWDYNRGGSGGGAGGLIWLEAEDEYYISDGAEASVKGGSIFASVSFADDGQFMVYNDQKWTNLFAKGGNSGGVDSSGAGAGGGGRIIIKSAKAAQILKQRLVKVKVNWVERGATEEIELFTFLSNFSQTQTSLDLKSYVSDTMRLFTSRGCTYKTDLTDGVCQAGFNATVAIEADKYDYLYTLAGSDALVGNTITKYDHQFQKVGNGQNLQVARAMAINDSHIYLFRFGQFCRYKKSDWSQDGCLENWPDFQFPGSFFPYVEALAYDQQNDRLIVGINYLNQTYTKATSILVFVYPNSTKNWVVEKKVVEEKNVIAPPLTRFWPDTSFGNQKIAVDDSYIYTLGEGWLSRWDKDLKDATPIQTINEDKLKISPSYGRYVPFGKDLVSDSQYVYTLSHPNNEHLLMRFKRDTLKFVGQTNLVSGSQFSETSITVGHK